MFVAMRDPDNIEKQNHIIIKLSVNINDFYVSKLDKTEMNLIVFDD